jgi:hypothetical protein
MCVLGERDAAFDQKDSGHDGMFHETLPSLVDAIDQWLVARDLSRR